ncbi:MAG: hypothetical protein AVDCRST_MAG68-3427 [uncultured Gemmatimonadetes bacterium]|uniref:Uncharacterized protein n=1 Tax=uncultured Gemmatimonadota bacterium TaxID=203437 RepID=A0A6J4LPD6_9BACT|nr:MAG: hypothetical protein AVDCRST_MAG68-3427 [uncultured Gemmatimonadota bacterium]
MWSEKRVEELGRALNPLPLYALPIVLGWLLGGVARDQLDDTTGNDAEPCAERGPRHPADPAVVAIVGESEVRASHDPAEHRKQPWRPSAIERSGERGRTQIRFLLP